MRVNFFQDQPSPAVGLKVRIHLSGGRDLTQALPEKTRFLPSIVPKTRCSLPALQEQAGWEVWSGHICRDSQQEASHSDAPEGAPASRHTDQALVLSLPLSLEGPMGCFTPLSVKGLETPLGKGGHNDNRAIEREHILPDSCIVSGLRQMLSN